MQTTTRLFTRQRTLNVSKQVIQTRGYSTKIKAEVVQKQLDTVRLKSQERGKKIYEQNQLLQKKNEQIRALQKELKKPKQERPFENVRKVQSENVEQSNRLQNFGDNIAAGLICTAIVLILSELYKKWQEAEQEHQELVKTIEQEEEENRKEIEEISKSHAANEAMLKEKAEALENLKKEKEGLLEWLSGSRAKAVKQLEDGIAEISKEMGDQELRLTTLEERMKEIDRINAEWEKEVLLLVD
jgi:chromosome segregation ATPase